MQRQGKQFDASEEELYKLQIESALNGKDYRRSGKREPKGESQLELTEERQLKMAVKRRGHVEHTESGPTIRGNVRVNKDCFADETHRVKNKQQIKSMSKIYRQ
jgi:hypothetical protein